MLNADHLTKRHGTVVTADSGGPGKPRRSPNRSARIAEIPGGSWTKWVVVGFWVVVLIVAVPLAKKLNGAEKNDASAYLPASAESTKVLDVLSHFQSPNIYPAIVVYQRASGRCKVAAGRRGSCAVSVGDFIVNLSMRMLRCPLMTSGDARSSCSPN